MATKLDQLIERIHPERTRKVVERRADAALISFPIKTNTFQDAIRLRSVLCEFARHLDRHLGSLPEDVAVPDDVAWQRAVKLLRQIFGQQGELAAFEIVRSSGLEGGLYTVLKQIARRTVQEHVNREVTARVDAFCHSLTADEYLAAASEYLEKYGHLLPPEMAEGYAGRVRVNLPQVLKQHHRAQEKLEKIAENLP